MDAPTVQYIQPPPGYPQQYQMGYGYPGVITQPPPTVNQTTVVVNQSPALYKPPRDWSTGICGCFDDIKVCLCVLCCEPCAEIKLSMDMGEHYCVPCCVPNWLVVLRTKLRTQHNIQGGVLNDCCTVSHCRPLVLCQMMREVNIMRKAQPIA
ncbi:cornifelin-like [Pomacea canaliculata]|uniref:cornifelin-like n=1 Tax=Pomacea canaliculata TaxID=400727 RepID=UPI000D73C6AD|nr:cornifelin-like [Pomacea canaliculata]XP_025091186.1 cornifelin-like [Pomacea canaliculata]